MAVCIRTAFYFETRPKIGNLLALLSQIFLALSLQENVHLFPASLVAEKLNSKKKPSSLLILVSSVGHFSSIPGSFSDSWLSPPCLQAAPWLRASMPLLAITTSLEGHLGV